jgi:hypothetical protein
MLVNFMSIWSILQPFCIILVPIYFVVILVYFPVLVFGPGKIWQACLLGRKTVIQNLSAYQHE